MPALLTVGSVALAVGGAPAVLALSPEFSVCADGGAPTVLAFADDPPFIVLTETKFSIRYIPVWARYSPLRTRVEAHAITLSP